MKNFFTSILSLITFLSFGQVFFNAPPPDGSSTQVRAPNGTVGHTTMRGVVYITAAEMAAGGSNYAINSFGFNLINGVTIAPVNGSLTLYFQLTNDASNLKSSTWATAITGMTTVYNNSLMTIPVSTGTSTINLPLTTSFNYTGNAMYVAYDWVSNGPFTSSLTPATYSANSSIGGSGLAAANNTNISPTTLGTTAFRPAFRFGTVSTLTVDFNVPSTICVGSPITFTNISLGATNYTWTSIGGSVPSSNLVNHTLLYSSAGIYTVTLAASNSSNTASITKTISVSPLPIISANNGTICSGNTFSIIPSGANTYTIQGGSSNVSPTSNTSYTVIGTSAAGCLSSNTATSNITVNASPIISVNSGSICSGNSFSIIPNGANTYTIQGGSTNISPLISSSYTVIGTSANGCLSSNTATSSVTVNPNPTVSANSGAICSGNSFSIIPSGASTYTIQGGSANVSPTVNSSYTVIGTSAAGCLSSNTATSNVVISPNPLVSVNSGTICSGNSFSIIPSGANSYTIQGGSSNVSPTVNSSYTVIGTSAAGCLGSNTATSLVTVNTSPAVSATSNITGTMCAGQTATLTANGALTYTWSTNSNAPIIVITPSVTTTYSVSGTNANGCVNSATIAQNVSPCTGINNNNIIDGMLLIYPNPANEYVSVKFADQIFDFKMYDSQGKLILDNYSVNEELIINCNNFPKGIYLLIINNKTIKINKKLVIE